MTDAPPSMITTNEAVEPPAAADNRLRPVDQAIVLLLCSAAVFIALACAALVLTGGPSDKWETGLWVVAFGIALPVGLILGFRQARRLGGAPEPVTRWALAFGTALILLGLVQLRLFATGTVQLGLLGLSGVAAYGVTEMAIRQPAVFRRLEALPSYASLVVGIGALLVGIALFTPLSVAKPRSLVPSLALAAVILSAVLFFDRRTFRPWRRRLVDLGLCVVLAMVVFQVKMMPGESFILVHHHDFYLGPMNDLGHGRGMLVDVFAQYGVGSYYVLLAALSVLPLNHGGLILLLATLMIGQYVLVYLTLRMAIKSQALVVAAVGAAVVGNIFFTIGSYVEYPSVGPMRFGLPYLIVAAAVAAARWPRRARALRFGQLAVVGVAAVWSFEMFVYTGATWFAVSALIAFGRREVPLQTGLRMFVRDMAAAAAVSVAAVAAFTIGIRVIYGAWPAWAGYLDYVRLYSVDEFGTLRVDFWSPAMLFAATIFLSAVGVTAVARDGRFRAPAPVLAAIAGFTGFSTSTFTYYLGRSHPNNLLNLLVPLCALVCLWASLLLVPRQGAPLELGAARGQGAPGEQVAALEQSHRAWRVVPLAFVLWVASTLIVFGWPSAQQKWNQTFFAQAVPFADGGAGLSVRTSLKDLWDGHYPENDPFSVTGARMLQRYVPGDGPALVVAPQATEILLKARRMNLLPISNPEMDSLVISDRWPRVAATIDGLPDGTMLLTLTGLDPARYQSAPIMLRAIEELHRKFDFEVLETSAEGVQMVRLHSHR